MSEIRDRLTKLINQERELRGYSTSSPWSNFLRPAISYLELAETATNTAEKFRNAWSALYNLWMMMQQRGEIENTTFTRFFSEVAPSPTIRNIALSTPTAFLEALKKGQNAFLFNAESKKPREAKLLVELWLDRRKKGRDVSPGDSVKYLFLIGRDVRNALSHPTLDPKSSHIRKTLTFAGDVFLQLAIAATEAVIEHPPEGTTGRVVAYRSFLYPFLKNSDSSFSDYYLERLFPEQELSTFPEDEAKTDLREITKELAARRKDLVRADTEATLDVWCDPVLFRKLDLAPERGVKIVTADGVFEPTAVLKKSEQLRLHKEYKGKDAGRDVACMIWVLPWSTSLDAVSADEESNGKTVMEVAQSALTRADVDWAILTNGQKVRLLGKATAHKPRSFMEIDLVAISERWVEREAQLAFRYLLGLCSAQSITEKDSQDRTRLERALRESERHGKEITDELKKNVFSALEELGEGFLAFMRSRPAELEAWRQQRAPLLSTEEFLKSQELLADIYHESLSLMYRLLFLFYAEGRDLLPMDDETYRDSYSLESIRDDIIATHDDPDPRSFFSPGAFDLWDRLKELFAAVDGGWQNIIPAYNGGLFDPEQHPFLETFKINDQQLARAIDLLSRTRPGALRGEGRKKVTYRDLDVRHLGSIYEGILEYHAEIADQEKVIVKRGSGGKAAEEYVAASELTGDEKKHLKAYREAVKEDEENPTLPRGCKVTGLVEPGEYYLIYGGRESKRKSSGSYYTPDYIVQYIVENTLGPLVRGETRPKTENGEARPLSSSEILELKVLDPAMGSGHFLVAATEYLARAYGVACIRESKDKDGAMNDDDFVHYKRIIAERCIYGVDKNPMAVELAKLSVWLFTMDKGRPLSFVNHHLKTGNAIVGAWIKDLGVPPEFDANGKLRRKKRRDTKTGNLFEVRFRERVPVMVRDLFGITEKETLDIADIRAKKSLDVAVDQIRQPFRSVADLWVGLFFGETTDDYNSIILDVEKARHLRSDHAIKEAAFHWELEFPEVFFDRHGYNLTPPGFSAVIGNPPYIFGRDWEKYEIQEALKGFISARYDTIRYQLDYFAAFMQLARNLVNPEQGQYSFIVPNVWLSNKYYNLLRASILQSSNQLTIALPAQRVFPESAVDTVVIRAKNGSPPVGSISQETILADGSLETSLPLIDAMPLRAGDKVIRVGATDAVVNALRLIEAAPHRFGQYFDIARGVHCYRTDGFGQSAYQDGPQTQRDFDERPYNSPVPEEGYTPYVEGKDLVSFGEARHREYVKWGPWLAEPREWRFFQGERLFTRKVLGKRLLATISDRTLITNQQVYICLPNEPTVNVRFFMGILASSCVSFYVRHGFNEEGDLFPQIKISQLRTIPIPSVERIEQDEIVRIVKSIERAVEKNSNRFDLEKMADILHDLDQAVLRLFEFPFDIARVINAEQKLIDRNATSRNS